MTELSEAFCRPLSTTERANGDASNTGIEKDFVVKMYRIRLLHVGLVKLKGRDDEMARCKSAGT
jgi:hypothetical protein